jgi:hypothetical protein
MTLASARAAHPAIFARRSLVSLVALGALAGCNASAAPLWPAADPAPAARPGHDLPSTPAPDRPADAIAALRGRGEAGLRQVLAEYDRARGAKRAALGSTVDAVAAQRYATVSRLYWTTELAAAQAEAQRTGKPILALRMLGRLDEDLSCANSRYFRTALYPDARVSALLRDRFVLLWTSEREVPRVTIDYGDGRTLVGTVTGNSIHYVLDAQGRVLDALPGLYAPTVFARELEAAHALAGALRGLPAEEQQRALATYWTEKAQQIWRDYSKSADALWDPERRQLFAQGEPGTAVARAQRATIGKAAVEVPLIHQIAAGTDPGTIDHGDVARWASIGQAMFGIGQVHLPGEGGDGEPPAQGAAARAAGREAAGNVGPAPERAEGNPGRDAARQRRNPPRVLDARARQLIAAVYAEEKPGLTSGRGLVAAASSVSPVVSWSSSGAPRSPEEAAARAPSPPSATALLIARFEQRMVADTALNQVMLRPSILARLGASESLAASAAAGSPDAAAGSLESINAWIYATVFATPRGDAWLGLRPRDEYTGLPGDGALLLQ